MPNAPAAPSPPPVPRSAARRRRWPLLAAGLVALLVLAGGALAGAFAAGWLGDGAVPAGTPPPAAPALTADERAYYAYVAPRVHEAAGQARELARLGATKSRNLIEIEAHGNRLTTLINEVTAYQRAHGIPPRFAAPAAAFAAGARQTSTAMDEARRGFLTFDWNRVARAVPLFDAGATALERAASGLDAAGGVPATPAA